MAGKYSPATYTLKKIFAFLKAIPFNTNVSLPIFIVSSILIPLSVRAYTEPTKIVKIIIKIRFSFLLFINPPKKNNILLTMKSQVSTILFNL